MAERRMFAKSVINSARFLRMPSSSRLLYYDLGMASDDDGIVEAFTVMRTTGATEDDLRVLSSKQFVTILNEDLVAYINDWKTNNLIRGDRYRESVYKELLIRVNSDMQPIGSQTVNQTDAQRLTQDRIGKFSVGKYKNTIGASAPDGGDEKQPSHTKAGFEQFWSLYPKKIGKQAALKSWSKLKPSVELTQRIMAAVEQQRGCDQWNRDNGQYIPNPATWLNQGRWDDELRTGGQTNGGHQQHVEQRDESFYTRGFKTAEG